MLAKRRYLGCRDELRLDMSSLKGVHFHTGVGPPPCISTDCDGRPLPLPSRESATLSRAMSSGPCTRARLAHVGVVSGRPNRRRRFGKARVILSARLLVCAD